MVDKKITTYCILFRNLTNSIKSGLQKGCSPFCEGIFYDLWCAGCFCDCCGIGDNDDEVIEDRMAQEINMTAEELAASKEYVLIELEKVNKDLEKAIERAER